MNVHLNGSCLRRCRFCGLSIEYGNRFFSGIWMSYMMLLVVSGRLGSDVASHNDPHHEIALGEWFSKLFFCFYG